MLGLANLFWLNGDLSPAPETAYEKPQLAIFVIDIGGSFQSGLCSMFFCEPA